MVVTVNACLATLLSHIYDVNIKKKLLTWKYFYEKTISKDTKLNNPIKFTKWLL